MPSLYVALGLIVLGLGSCVVWFLRVLSFTFIIAVFIVVALGWFSDCRIVVVWFCCFVLFWVVFLLMLVFAGYYGWLVRCSIGFLLPD